MEKRGSTSPGARRLGGPRAAFAGAAALALVVAACGSGDTSGATGTTSAASSGAKTGGALALGVTMPLTGDTADFGIASQRGAILATEQINAAGGVNGKPLKTSYEDFANDPAKAVSAFTKLTSVNHSPVILSGTSAGVLAQGPLAARDKTVLINGAASAPEMRKFGSGGYFYSVINDSNAEALDLVKYVKETLHASKVAMVYSNEPIGQGAQKAFEKAAKADGISISKEIAMDADNHDYRQQISQLQSLKPQVVIAASFYDPVGFLLKQAGQAGFKTTWVGGQTTINPSTLKTAGAAADGYITIRPSFDTQLAASGDNATKRFEAAFKTKFGEEPTNYSAHLFDATNLVAKVVNDTKSTDPATIAQGLRKYTAQNPYDGVAGPIAFDKVGMVNQPEFVFKIQGGKVVPVDNAGSH